MKRLVLLFLIMAVSSSYGYAQDADQPDIVKRTQAAAQVLEEIMGTPDQGIPSEILDGAECVAITPSMFKAGIGIGGSYGRGVASCRTPNGWSAPAPYAVAGGSWGLQFGAQAVDVVMLVMNRQGVNNLLSSKFKIGADASAAAGPVGRHVSAGTDWKMRAQVLTYSRARGVFAGATLNGAAIKQDKDSTRILYGRMVPFEDILSGRIANPQGTTSLTEVLERFSPRDAETEKAGE